MRIKKDNPDAGEQGLKRVLNVFVKDIKELVHLKVREREIKTTLEHPFWVEGIGWVAAGDLKLGDRLVMYSGEILEVEEVFVEYLDKPIKVYNFEVEDWHTYFVSDYNVFVHNAGCGGSSRGSNKLKSDPEAHGNAHSTFKTDPKTGMVTNYETYEPNPKKPIGVDKVKRYDGAGDSHFNKVTKEYVDTPHVHDKNAPGGVRPANLDEIPG